MAWEGYHLLIMSWGMFSIATIFFAVRLFVQFNQRTLRWRESFVIVAWILYLAVCILNSVLTDMDVYNENLYDMVPEDATDDQVEHFFKHINKLVYATAFLWKPSIYCCKAALLLFFADLSPKMHYPKTWWSIMVTWVFVIIGCLFQVLMNLFDCWPFHLNWSENHGQCGYRMELMVTSMVFHVLTDLAVYGIPFVIFHNLRNLTTKQRRGAMLMFGIGGLNVACAMLMILAYALPDYLESDSQDGIYAAQSFTMEVQQGTALIIVCMPQVRRMYRILYSEKRQKIATARMPSESYSRSRKTGGGGSSMGTAVMDDDIEAGTAVITSTIYTKASNSSSSTTTAAGAADEITTATTTTAAVKGGGDYAARLLAVVTSATSTSTKTREVETKKEEPDWVTQGGIGVKRSIEITGTRRSLFVEETAKPNRFSNP